MNVRMLFVIDFDGTVAPIDTVDALLERFADPQWETIEREWAAGRIDSRQCMAAQVALVDGDRAELEAFLRSVHVDPGFPAFLHYVRPFAECAVVSDGLDYPIRHALRHCDIPIYANALRFTSRGLDLSFPYANASCTVGSGVCKCAVARSLDAGKGRFTVLIGDGRSDQCVARTADYVLAKGSLRTFCDREGIVYTPFETFNDVLAIVQAWHAQGFEVFQETACPLPAQ